MVEKLIGQIMKLNFKKLTYKDNGKRTGIFGDMDLEGHREWVERVCSEFNNY